MRTARQQHATIQVRLVSTTSVSWTGGVTVGTAGQVGPFRQLSPQAGIRRREHHARCTDQASALCRAGASAAWPRGRTSPFSIPFPLFRRVIPAPSQVSSHRNFRRSEPGPPRVERRTGRRRGQQKRDQTPPLRFDQIARSRPSEDCWSAMAATAVSARTTTPRCRSPLVPRVSVTARGQGKLRTGRSRCLPGARWRSAGWCRLSPAWRRPVAAGSRSWPRSMRCWWLPRRS